MVVKNARTVLLVSVSSKSIRTTDIIKEITELIFTRVVNLLYSFNSQLSFLKHLGSVPPYVHQLYSVVLPCPIL
jgi:hypothetical protein